METLYPFDDVGVVLLTFRLYCDGLHFLCVSASDAFGLSAGVTCL